jgi:hypothetical protein
MLATAPVGDHALADFMPEVPGIEHLERTRGERFWRLDDLIGRDKRHFLLV